MILKSKISKVKKRVLRTMKGKSFSLSMLLANVVTPQYKELEEVQRVFRKRIEHSGFPCNQFGSGTWE